MNVSSIKGKERILLFPSNKELNTSFPPFREKTFVKLDSFVAVDIDAANSLVIVANVQTLNTGDLNYILTNYKEFNT